MQTVKLLKISLLRSGQESAYYNVNRQTLIIYNQLTFGHLFLSFGLALLPCHDPFILVVLVVVVVVVDSNSFSKCDDYISLLSSEHQTYFYFNFSIFKFRQTV